ncbi:MAG: hypothetical protein ACRDDA_05620 [Aeromonas sp.]
MLNKFPNLREGAWIEAVETETQGQKLAVGVLKVLLTNVFGSIREAEDILFDAGLSQAVETPDFDGQSFDQYRGALWGAIRTLYPMKFNEAKLAGSLRHSYSKIDS